MKRILCILLTVLVLVSSNLSINNSIIYADEIEPEEPSINEVSEETDLQLLLDELALIEIDTIIDEDIDSIKEKIEQVETIILTLSEEEIALYDFSTYNTLKEYIDNYEIQEPSGEIEEDNDGEDVEEDVENKNDNDKNSDDEIVEISEEELLRLAEKVANIPMNYKPDTYPEDGLLHKKKQRPGLLNAAPDNLPSSYSSKDEGYISFAKYQNPYGTCWAFAAVGAAEANYAKNHDKELIDLSELHLSNYAYITWLCDDPLNLINYDGLLYVYDYGDGYEPCPYNDPIEYPDDNRLQVGGNQSITEQIIGSGVGFTSEENMPYPEDHENASDIDLKDESYCYHTDYILKETNVFSMTETDEIKKAIMEYGALAVSYLHYPDNAETPSQDFYDYYGVDGKSYFHTTEPEQGSNHAVTLIGWDDNYSVDNFGKTQNEITPKPKPSSPGAWILKNSWDTDFGDEGCFYISYEESSLRESEAFAYVIEEVGANDYDIYQYDGAGFSQSFTVQGINSIYEAAVFTAQKSETLDYVAVTTMNTDISYQVNVFTNLADETDPTSGTLVYQKNGTSPLSNAGYHTIPIDEEIPLSKGKKFSVVVKLTNPSGDINIPTDVYTNENEPLWGCIQSISFEAPNQTFLSVTNINELVDQYDPDPSISATMKVKAICHEHVNSSYTIEHYFQNIDNDEYTIDETLTETKTGKIGTKVTAQNLSVPGFTFVSSSPTVKTGNIKDDNSLTLKLYYKRNKYTVTFKGNGGKVDGVTTKTFNEKYGKEISIPTPDRGEYYSFIGWSPTLEGSTLTVPTSNVTYTAQWMEITPTHTITFNKNGHAESYQLDSYEINEGYSLDGYYLPTLYDEDYWFAGWDQLLPKTMPNHDIVLNAVWEERKDVPADLNVSLDSNDDTIIISTNDENYLEALMFYYDYRYRGETPLVEVKQGKYLKNDNTTEDTSENFNNRVYYDSSTPNYYTQLEKIDSTHVKVSAYEAENLSNGVTDITVVAKGYKPFDTSVTFSKLIPICPDDVTYSFLDGVLTVNSTNKTWLKAICNVVLTEVNSCDSMQDIRIPRYVYEDDIYYINYVNDHLEITIPNTINKYGTIQNILKNHAYRIILSPRDSYSYGAESIYISNSDKVIESQSFNKLISTVFWTFKCANNKLYIGSTNDEWLDELVAGNIGIKFYPSHTYYYSLSIKNSDNYHPIKRENGCVTISDADLKQCGIYKGTYNAIYFDELDDYNYPDLYNTYQKTYNTYSWQEGFKLTYGKALEKIPTVTLSEGDNGSLNIYSSNEQFLKNIMYVMAINNNSKTYSPYFYYPYDISDIEDNVENHISNNTLNIPDMKFENGSYSFEIGSYGFVADNLNFTATFPYYVCFENIQLEDLPDVVDIVSENNNYYLTSNNTDYIDAYDTMNANYQQENEYYKYSPKSFMGFGAGGSSYFIDKDFYSKKVTNTKATITSVGQGRTKITVEVPGYKTLTKILGEKEYVVHELDGIKVKTVNKKVYLYPGNNNKLTNLLNKISYNNVSQYSLIGFIRYGDNENEYYDSKNSDDGYIERNDLSTGEDDIGPYLCIDLSNRKFFSNSQYTKEPFFVYLDLNYNVRDNTCGAIAFCINRDQYFINYHDETYHTFMPNTDFPFYYVGKTVTLEDLYHSSYAFDGWYTKDGTGNDWGEKVTSITSLNAANLADENDDINLYAKWFTTEKNTLSGVTANLESGEVEKGTMLVLTTSEPTAQIRYTTDGASTPTVSSNLYSGPIVINEDITIKANVFEDGKTSPTTPLTLTFTVATEQDDTGGVTEPSTGLWTSDLQNITYDPSLKQFTQTDLKVFHYKTLLTEGKDYTVKYANNKKAGTATLTITGKGSYAGTLTKTFEIEPLVIDSSTVEITINKTVFKNNGKVQKPSIKSVEYENPTDGKIYKLKNNTDYIATIPNDSIDADTYYVSIVGNGNYSTASPLTRSYEITDLTPVETLSVSGLKGSYSYADGGVEPDTLGTITVKNGKTVLEKDVDYQIYYEANGAVGTATMIINGVESKGYYGTLRKTFKITGTALSSYKLLNMPKSVEYTGSEITLDNVVEFSKTKNGVTETLTGKAKDEYDSIFDEGIDYLISYQNNTNIGTATVIFEGNTREGFTGTVKKTFKITGQTFNAKTVTVSGINSAGYTYTGSEIKPTTTLTLTNEGTSLTENDDYEVSYKANINAGTATITFKGIGQYTGSFSVKFKINKASLDSSQFSGLTENDEIEYSKGGVKPVITSSLVLNKDYSIKYTNNTILNDNSNQKKITSVVLTGKGNYQGTVTIPFIIVQQNINKVTITVPDKAYADKVNAYKSTPTLIDLDGKKLAAGTDYDKNITYRYRYDTWVDVYDSKYKSYTTKLRSENELVGPNDIVPGGAVIKVTVNGIKNYTGSISTVYKVGWIDISKASITIPVQYYSGKPICPTQDEIVVKIGKDEIDSSNYYISSYSNNISKGTASLTIKGKGDFCGEKTVKFTISSMNFGTVIRFYPNGDVGDVVTGTMKDQIITKNAKLTKNSYKIAGKTFVGWSTSSGATEAGYINNGDYAYNPDDSGKMIKLYAIWQ